MPGYLAVKALPIFPTSAVSKCAVYQVTSPSAFAFAARSANSSSARAGACAAKIANEDNADIAQSNFISALHALGLGRHYVPSMRRATPLQVHAASWRSAGCRGKAQ